MEMLIKDRLVGIAKIGRISRDDILLKMNH